MAATSTVKARSGIRRQSPESPCHGEPHLTALTASSNGTERPRPAGRLEDCAAWSWLEEPKLSRGVGVKTRHGGHVTTTPTADAGNVPSLMTTTQGAID
jgi:hypothetical protein